MEKEREIDIVENTIRRTAESSLIVGEAVRPVANRIGETGKFFLTQEVHRLRRKHGN